jgi:hypothetical protein
MRHLTLSLAVLAALIGCESKEEPKHASGTPGTMTASGGGDSKATETSAVAKHPWGSFKKGSFTKMKTVNDMGGNKTEMMMTYTLKEVTPDEAIVETEMVMANLPAQKQEMKMPLKAHETKTTADGPKPKTGTEEIEVAGKKMKCKWTEMETDAAGSKMVTKTYTCEEVPGFTVKSVTKSPTMTSTMEVVEYSAK